MQIKIDIQVDPMETWQRNRLAKMIEKFREDLKGIQYEDDSDALIAVHEVTSTEIAIPPCPDSPDGKHHSAPIDSEEEYVLGCAGMECYYCGEKATVFAPIGDREVFRG